MSHLVLMSAAEVADRLQITPRSVARMVESGGIEAAAKAPGKRGAYLFDPIEVDRVASERAQ